jgi:hypothetical protein
MSEQENNLETVGYLSNIAPKKEPEEDGELYSESSSDEPNYDKKDFFINQEEGGDNNEKNKEGEKVEELSCKMKVLKAIFSIPVMVSILTASVLIYFVFANLLQYSFYPLIYEWISTCSKTSSFSLIMTVFSSLSDYGLFFSLILFSWEIIRNFIDIILYIAEKVFEFFKDISNNEAGNDFADPNDFICELGKISAMFAVFDGIVIGALFYPPMMDVVLTLIVICVIGLIYSLPSVISMHNIYNTTNHEDCDENVEENPKNAEEKLWQIFDMLIEFATEYSQMITGVRGIKYGEPRKEISCCCEDETDKEVYSYKHGLLYKVIVTILVLGGQVYIIVVSCIGFKDVSLYGKIGIVTGVIMRITGLFRAIDINIYDSIFYQWKFWTRLSNVHGTFAYIITMVFYALAIFFLGFIKSYLTIKEMPYIDLLKYTKNEEVWNRNDERFSFPALCKTQPFIKTSLNTVDFAVLATLPRLYYVDKSDGKCYIKPKLRGVFDSTMKYVFGEDYKDQGITILCYPKTHNPYLVLTSDSLLNEMIGTDGKFSDAVELERQFAPKSNNYFSEPLCEKDEIAHEECLKYKECHQNNNCQDEGDVYFNTYWQNYNGTGPETPGFEQYQYTITDNITINPRLITKNGTKLNGLHIVLGASFEDDWGYAYLVENLIRVYIPIFFNQFIPLFSFVTSFFSVVFNLLTEFVLGFVYVETLSYNEMVGFSDLISRFNFSQNSIFMVGHSISGTTIKEFSFVSDIGGIAFEASNGLNYAEYRLSDRYNKVTENTKLVHNIYSSGVLLSGYDSDFPNGGELPKKFYNPNSLDNACLVVATCSETKKYVPFCNQVLNQGGANSTLKFQEIIDAVNARYF